MKTAPPPRPRPHKTAEIQERENPLKRIFQPSSVVVIGATEKQGSVGRTVLENLLGGGFGGTIQVVNPKRERVLGVRCHHSVSELPAPPDLAVIVTPAVAVPEVVGECSRIGIPGAIIISAGFKECGEAGMRLEQLVEARRGSMRIVGPNCLGLMVPRLGLNATFAKGMARPGNVGFLSQSGALGTAILDWSRQERVGFSTFVSIGSMLDVGWGDLLNYLGDDPQTHSIVIYMESIGDARAFLSAAREVALTKPIVVIKVGRTPAAARAAASHTGSLTGSDEVLDAAFRRAGVLRVNTIAELFLMAEVLGKQPRPQGPRLAIVTNGGGPGALATDVLTSEGGEIANLSAESLGALSRLLPPHWSHGNPVDILGDASAECFAKAVEIVAQDHGNDGILVILTPQAMTEPVETAERISQFAELTHKPILASWMGGEEVAEGRRILAAAEIPSFAYPDTAARTFCSMWRYSHNLRALYETPSQSMDDGGGTRGTGKKIIAQAMEEGRTLLTEREAKEILRSYQIPVSQVWLAETEEEAVERAKQTGFPAVLKLHSTTITHKTDVGGVKLDLRTDEEVRSAFRQIKASITARADATPFEGVTVQPMHPGGGIELILGSSTDAQFGPVLLFGAGGTLVETLQDRSLGLPPLNATLARRLMEGTRIFQGLRGIRGKKPVDLAALDELLVRFSQLVLDHPRIKEIEINPLVADSKVLQALDARVVLHPATISDDQLPKPAIRPYPEEYLAAASLAEGTPIRLRPIRPEDEPLMVDFHRTLSADSIHYRYFNAYKLEARVAHDRLSRVCFNDYDREIALVAELPKEGTPEIIGVGRLIKGHGIKEAEFAIIISDAWQGKGLGRQMLDRLIAVARSENLTRLTAHILPDNRGMLSLCRKAGFHLHHDYDLGEYFAELKLSQREN